MHSKTSLMSLYNDVLGSATLAFRSKRKDLFKTWVLAPFGIVVMLYFVLVLDLLISLGTIQFPATVACLLILFFSLLVADALLGEVWMNTILKVLDVPTGFALRTMSLYFTPSFILLPQSTGIGGREVGALIGVFVIGFVVQFGLTAYTSRAIQQLLGKVRKSDSVRSDEVLVRHSGESSSGTIVRTRGGAKISGNIELPNLSTSTIWTKNSTFSGTQLRPNSSTSPTSPTMVALPPGTESTPASSGDQPPDNLSRKQKWADLTTKYLDVGIYLCIFIFIGIPVYYATGYTMPIFISFNVFMFFAANEIPANIKRIAHPVLVTSLISVLGIWVIALTEGRTLNESLQLYETGTKYLQYFRGTKDLPLPGAGDILASLLDASIVALAMPMYQYRKDLAHFFVAIFIPSVVLTLPSLFGYPPLCFAIGISATRSLAMAPRSVTLALAQLSTENLGGDTSAISPIAVVSGISGPIFGPTILRMLRIPKDDYVTTGVVLGANSSAIATAMLLKKDRRAAALSALSMSIFGLLFVILTAIPPVVTYVRSLVGL